jgi:Fe-S cluster biosynthesis and repair protein YggX
MLVAGARLRTNAVRARTMLAQQLVVFLFCALLVQT